MNHKVAVFFSSGIGNALLFTPLLKELKVRQYQVDGIFTSPTEDLFKGSGLILKNKKLRSWFDLLYFLFSFKRYHTIYIDFFSATRKHIYVSWWISKNLVVHKKKELCISGFIAKKIRWVDTPLHENMASLNLRLLENKRWTSFDFSLPKPKIPKLIPFTTYWVLQLGSGNNKTPYKTWPAKYWAELMRRLLDTHSNLHFVLLGDLYETHLVNEIRTSARIYNLIGKTTLKEAAGIIAGAKLLLGHDSGLMHIAVAVDTPTLTVWGGSDQHLYGYAEIDSTKHTVISSKKSCWPCNSWLNPNTTRVKDPLNCPDQACIREISVDQVYTVLLQKHVQ